VVANSDDDSVSSIDTVKQQVGRSFTANPAPGAPQQDALGGGEQLLVRIA
jgi:hypothetical protein